MSSFFEFSPEEVKKTEDRLSDRLEKMLLLLYLLEIDKKTLIVLGKEILLEEFNIIVIQIQVETERYGFASITEQTLKEHLERVYQDWSNVVKDTVIPTEPAEPEKEIVNRASLIGWFLVWTMFNQATVEIAKNEGVVFLEWTILENPPTPVCEICKSLAGFYNIETYLPEMPQHINCRCRWRLWFVTPVIDNRPITRVIQLDDLYMYHSHGGTSTP